MEWNVPWIFPQACMARDTRASSIMQMENPTWKVYAVIVTSCSLVTRALWCLWPGMDHLAELMIWTMFGQYWKEPYTRRLKVSIDNHPHCAHRIFSSMDHLQEVYFVINHVVMTSVRLFHSEWTGYFCMPSCQPQKCVRWVCTTSGRKISALAGK